MSGADPVGGAASGGAGGGGAARVFVYDGLRSEYSASSLVLGECRLVGRAAAADPPLRLLHDGAGVVRAAAAPAAAGAVAPARARVAGEVWEVPRDVLRRLDQMEGATGDEGAGAARRPVTVRLQGGGAELACEAYVYAPHMVPAEDWAEVASGDVLDVVDPDGDGAEEGEEEEGAESDGVDAPGDGGHPACEITGIAAALRHFGAAADAGGGGGAPAAKRPRGA